MLGASEKGPGTRYQVGNPRMCPSPWGASGALVPDHWPLDPGPWSFVSCTSSLAPNL